MPLPSEELAGPCTLRRCRAHTCTPITCHAATTNNETAAAETAQHCSPSQLAPPSSQPCPLSTAAGKGSQPQRTHRHTCGVGRNVCHPGWSLAGDVGKERLTECTWFVCVAAAQPPAPCPCSCRWLLLSQRAPGHCPRSSELPCPLLHSIQSAPHVSPLMHQEWLSGVSIKKAPLRCA